MSVQDWQITSIQTIGNRKIVAATNTVDGATMDVDVTVDALAPTYHATMAYTYPLTPSQIDTLNAVLIARVRSQYQALGQPLPPLLSPGSALTVNMTNMDFDAHDATYNGNATASLGQSLSGNLLLGAIRGSVQVSYTGTKLAPMVIPRGNPDAFATIENFTVHRRPSDGSIDMSFNGKNNGGVVVDDLLMASIRPPVGPHVLFGVEVNFANGTVALPVPVQDFPAVQLIGEAVRGSYTDGASAVMAVATEGKYTCIRGIISGMGATFLCMLGMVAAGGATVGTVGGGIPVLTAAIIACLGAEALIWLDVILAHLGWD